MMMEYESISFNRIFRNEYIEFFLIVGVNNQENFTTVWDGRDTKLVGYLAIYTNFDHDQEPEQLNLIYLIDGVSLDNDRIIKHTRKFIEDITIKGTGKYVDFENVKIYYTQEKGNGYIAPYHDLVKLIIQNEIPIKFTEKL